MQEDLLKELKDISILCVEDEDGIREMIVSTLKFYFKEVYEAIDMEMKPMSYMIIINLKLY